ncbi:MAG: hypothetical protein Q8P18_21460 [Pseudomonadota bacterium]|nr:hypothetical protein [Pseudomonadota bacterium]
MRIVGARPRPRVAMFGPWTEDEIAVMRGLFPTVYSPLEALGVAAEEVDLVLGLSVSPRRFPIDARIPAFSGQRSALQRGLVRAHLKEGDVIPAPHARRHLIFFGTGVPDLQIRPDCFYFEPAPSTGQQYAVPSLAPTLNAVRESEIKGVDDVRGWPVLATNTPADWEAFSAGALLLSTKPSDRVLATVCVRPSTGTGFAWLPWEPKHLEAWVSAIVEQWAKVDRDAFAGVVPWREQTAWLSREERTLLARREQVATTRAAALAAYDDELSGLDLTLAGARSAGDRGARALLTEQEEPLVQAVAAAFRSLGFEVEEMDPTWGDGPKREDLRVRDPGTPKWEALVEVKGHRRGGASEGDLRKITRHIARYEKEKGRPPSSAWYVVNGQFELEPSLRHAPFASAPDVAQEFGTDDAGLVIGTVDLFRAAVVDPARRDEIREALMRGRGRFECPSS